MRPKNEAKQLYHGPGWIGNQWREVNCWSLSNGYQIAVAGAATFWLSNDGSDIVLTEQNQEASTDFVLETMLGPSLILALALKDIYCLHASAVIVDGQVILFLGESGKGKSTLASWLDDQEEASWRRLCDDVMPVTGSSEGVDVLSHFPQLKIPAGKQPSKGHPVRVPLSAVYLLDTPESHHEVKIEAMDVQEGTLALVHHTVASRLFDGDLLAKQLDFCVQTATAIPVRKLIYPLTLDALPLVREALSYDIQSAEFSSGALETTDS